MLKLLETITDPGKENYPNEDIIIISSDYYIILDGATGLGPSRIKESDSDAYWFVNAFKQYFLAQLANYSDVKVLLQNTLLKLELEYKKLVNTLPTKKYEFPSAGMILLHKINDMEVNAYRLGDCELFHCTPNQVTKVFKDSKLNDLDAISINKLSKHLLKGIDYQEARKLILPTLQKHRELMNTKDGYWVLSIIQSSITEIINNIECISIDLTRDSSLLLVSDGYGAIVEKYKQSNICQYTLEETLSKIRTIEKLDQELLTYPRLKHSDDSTAILLINQEN